MSKELAAMRAQMIARALMQPWPFPNKAEDPPPQVGSIPPQPSSCPFCGHWLSITAEDHQEPIGDVTYAARCGGCGARGPVDEACTVKSHTWCETARRYVPVSEETWNASRDAAMHHALELWNTRGRA